MTTSPTWPSLTLYPSRTTWPSDGNGDPGVNAWYPLQARPRADSVRALASVAALSTRLLGSIIPAYNYPSPVTTWNAWIAGSPTVKFMIGDPGSPGGPGTFTDTNYVAAFARARGYNIRVLGYVDTNYAAIASGVATGQVDSWKSLYGINDIFFDRTSSSASDLAYYQSLGNYVHATDGSVVMFNPGTNPAEGYFNGMADILCTFEGSQTDFDAYTPSTFMASYPRSMMAHLIYDVPTSGQMVTDIARSISLNAGYCYITDDTLAGFPWDTVPSYWTTEIATIGQ